MRQDALTVLTPGAHLCRGISTFCFLAVRTATLGKPQQTRLAGWLSSSSFLMVFLLIDSSSDHRLFFSIPHFLASSPRRPPAGRSNTAFLPFTQAALALPGFRSPRRKTDGSQALLAMPATVQCCDFLSPAGVPKTASICSFDITFPLSRVRIWLL